MMTYATNPAAVPHKGAGFRWSLYIAGLVVLVAMFVAGQILNPGGKKGVSRFVDAFEGPLFLLSMVFCALAPLWSSGSWLRRLRLLLSATLGYILVCVILFVLSILFVGVPMD
jgi:hypothetical protein